MITKYKKMGKLLSNEELKSIKGGNVLPPPCSQDSDCGELACPNGNETFGFICLNHACKWAVCA
jgi:hypothetical protein